MIGLTTGRQTNQRLNSLLKELAHTIPMAKVIRRGKSSISDLRQRFFEEEIEHALVLQRWHGGPGRIDFLKIDASTLTLLPPSMLLREVKLNREYSKQESHLVQTITCDEGVSQATRRFAHHLASFLNLSETTLPAGPEIRSTLRISEVAEGSLLLAVNLLPAQQEIGPRLHISRLLWDLNG